MACPGAARPRRIHSGSVRVKAVCRRCGDRAEMHLRPSSGPRQAGRILPGMRRPNGLLKHSAYFSQGRQRQRTPAAGGDRRQLEQPVLGYALSVLGFAARRSGLASDGLALAVRPAGGASGGWRIWREGDRPGRDAGGRGSGYGEDRRRPVTGGAVRGSRCAVGLASEGRGGSCRATRHPRWREPA
jgi:hypothetical protein